MSAKLESIKLIWAVTLLEYPENFFGNPQINSKAGYERFLGFSKHTGSLRRFINYLELGGILEFVNLRKDSDVKLYRINKFKLWNLLISLKTFNKIRQAKKPSDL